MPLFGRSQRPTESSLSPELQGIRRSIQNRGQAEIPAATARVDEFIRSIFRQCGCPDTETARRWADDRLRFMLVVGVSPPWLEFLAELPEIGELRAEFTSLVRNPEFGPGHLVAWWWLLEPPLFKRLIEARFEQLTPAFVDIVKDGVERGFPSEDFVDWPSFFEPG